MSVTIYALCEPDTGEVRYVGKTGSSVADRLANHRPDGSPRGQWVARLEAEGKRPVPQVLEVCGEAWHEAEARWIAHYRAEKGDRLLNVRGGGEGRPHHVGASISIRLSDTEREAIAAQGESVSAFVRAAVRARVVGRGLGSRLERLESMAFRGLPPFDKAGL